MLRKTSLIIVSIGIFLCSCSSPGRRVSIDRPDKSEVTRSAQSPSRTPKKNFDIDKMFNGGGLGRIDGRFLPALGVATESFLKSDLLTPKEKDLNGFSVKIYEDQYHYMILFVPRRKTNPNGKEMYFVIGKQDLEIVENLMMKQ